MKTLLNIIQERLHITKNTGKYEYEYDFNLIQKVIYFYAECFLSWDDRNFIKKNGVSDNEYTSTLDNINDIIMCAENQPKQVRGILFNNEFKDKNEVKKITELFINLANDTDKELKNKVKELYVNACKINY